MSQWTHFKLKYRDNEGNLYELEGGWTGYPDEWQDWSYQQKNDWWHALGHVWGMPEGCTVTGVRLCG